MLVYSHLRTQACSNVVHTFDQDSRVPGFRLDISSPCVAPWRRLVGVDWLCIFRDRTNPPQTNPSASSVVFCCLRLSLELTLVCSLALVAV
jgi:hypothetical protein